MSIYKPHIEKMARNYMQERPPEILHSRFTRCRDADYKMQTVLDWVRTRIICGFL
jgi:hypothetical protein